ncbi:MAG: hypothetical protein R6V83_09550 [Candidatus Thorarchaeota archaeon]
MSVSLPDAKKKVSVLGCPGVGKTTFLVAAIHQLDKAGWARADLETLPAEYGTIVDNLVAGKPLAPTVGLHGYVFDFNDFTYRNSEVKAGWFGSVSVRLTDLSGKDYQHSASLFKQSLNDVYSVLILIDPAREPTLKHSLAGQMGPIVEAIRYIAVYEDDIEHIGFVFTKALLHNHEYGRMVLILEEQLAPALNKARREGIDISFMEIDSRGPDETLEPLGIRRVFYDVLSRECKVKNERLDVTGPLERRIAA